MASPNGDRNAIHSVSEAIDFAQQWKNRWCGSRDSEPSRKDTTIGVWFRGQPDARWPLEPSVFRTEDGVLDETSMFREFVLRASARRHDHDSLVSWLALMQHYGLPTRTLDWTTNVLVGLFFAVDDDLGSTELITPPCHAPDGNLFVLDARALNDETRFRYRLFRDRQENRMPGLCHPAQLDASLRAGMARVRDLPTLLELATTIEVDELDATVLGFVRQIVGPLRRQRTRADRLPAGALPARPAPSLQQLHPRWERFERALAEPAAVFPDHSNPRLIAQSGMITVHGGKVYCKSDRPRRDPLPERRSIEAIDKEVAERRRTRLLSSAVIPGGCKRAILAELENLGIHRATLFPELDHQSRYLRTKWRFRE